MQMTKMPITIVALGDSKTAGVGDADGMGGYPKRVEAWLNQHHPGSRVYAFGALGWTSTDVVQHALDDAIAHQPQVALVWIGSNDVWKMARPDHVTQGLTTFRANLDATLDRLQQTLAHLVVGLLDNMAQRSVIKTFSNITQDDIAHLAKLVQRYNEVIKELAAQHEAITVNFYEAMLFREPAMFADDGTHPNADGYDQIAEMWINALRPML